MILVLTHVRKFEVAGGNTCRWVDVDSRGTVEHGGDSHFSRTQTKLRFLESLQPDDVIGIDGDSVYYRRVH